MNHRPTPDPRKRRQPFWRWLAPLALAAGLIWWWGPWRPWDVTIKFIEFDDSSGTRKAIFEIENRTNEELHGVPKNPKYFGYQLLAPGGERTCCKAGLGGGWYSVEPRSRRRFSAPLTDPEGSQVIVPFRLGLTLTDFRGQERMENVCKLPGWAAHWVRKGLPKAYFTETTEIHWSDVVTP